MSHNGALAPAWQPGRSGNPAGRTSTKWLRTLLDASHEDQTERQAVGLNIISIAKGPGREAVAAAKAIWAYDMGQAPKADPLALAEHFRKVELDKINLALAILGPRILAMAPEKVAEFFRVCAGNPLGFVQAAEQFLRGVTEGEPPQVEAVPEPDRGGTP